MRPATAAAGLVILMLAACGHSAPVGYGTQPKPAAGDASGTITVDGKTINDYGSADVAGKKDIVIELGADYFSPTTLTGTPGQEIQLELKNVSQVEHEFKIAEPGLSMNQPIAVGGDQYVTVNIPESGSVVYYCEYHQNQGMRGVLTAQ